MPNKDMDQKLENEGTWERVREKARQEWEELTDQELDEARRNFDQFVGTVKEKTNESAENIKRKFKEWTS